MGKQIQAHNQIEARIYYGDKPYMQSTYLQKSISDVYPEIIALR